jgi:hypothetical protein
MQVFSKPYLVYCFDYSKYLYKFERIPKQMSQIYHKRFEKYSYVFCQVSKLFFHLMMFHSRESSINIMKTVRTTQMCHISRSQALIHLPHSPTSKGDGFCYSTVHTSVVKASHHEGS